MPSLASKYEHIMQKYALIGCQTFLASANILWLYYRVGTGPGKPGKSWKFTVAFFQVWKVLEKGYWSWKVLEIC